MQIEDLRAASAGIAPSLEKSKLKARETSQEPLALGQMLGKNPHAGFSFWLAFIFVFIGVRGRDFGVERPAVGSS